MRGVKRVIFLVLGAGLAFNSCAQKGAEGAELSAPQFARLMQTIADGWNEGDARKAADCFTESAIYTEPPDKQLYRGREALYRFFGGGQGRKQEMKMDWHHLIFDEQRQVGAGEFTFEYGGRVHGMVMIKVSGGKVSNWREYWYESNLAWEDFIGENRF